MGVKFQIGLESIALGPGSSFAWSLAYGVKPSVSVLETTAASADRIRERSKKTFAATGRTRGRNDAVGPVKVLMEDDENGRKVEIEGAYVVISNRPGATYNTRTMLLTDQRWLWDRTFVEGSFNIRRKSGGFRMVQGAKTPIQLNRLRPDFGYRRSTLKDGERPWTALEVLKEVLGRLCGPSGYSIDSAPAFSDSIEGLELHDYGPEALARVLAFIPGAQVYVGHDGKVHVGSVYDGSELAAFQSFGAGNKGDWRLVDRSQMRPQSFRVYSDREVELRFDYVEERGNTAAVVVGASGNVSDALSAAFSNVPGEEPMWLENVIINPLYSLPLDAAAAVGSPGGRQAVQGEPVPVKQFLEAVGLLQQEAFFQNSFVQNDPNFRLSLQEIRRHWLGNWQAIVTRFAYTSAGVVSPERMKILDAIRAHWRQTYRILPQWRDKIRTLSNSRVAVLDYETGTTAPAAVYTDYLTKFSQLGYTPLAKGSMTTKTYDYADDLSSSNVSPFLLEVLDSDQALVRITPRTDQTGVASTFVLGGVDGDLPSADVANAAVFWNRVELSSDFRLAIVLTATQDSPNNAGRLHFEEITLAEASDPLRIPGVTGDGPPMELVQTAETARFGWSDVFASEIRKAFYGGTDPNKVEEYPDVIVNPDEIRALSVAAAAQALTTMLDKVEGRVTGPLRKIEPTGNLRTVTHFVSVGADGGAGLFTTIEAPGEVPAQQIYSLLPEGIRRKVRRLVQQ